MPETFEQLYIRERSERDNAEWELAQEKAKVKALTAKVLMLYVYMGILGFMVLIQLLMKVVQ